MSEVPEAAATIIANKTPPNMSPEMASLMENFSKKSPSTNGITTRQNLLNSSTTNSSTSVSKSSQQVSSARKFLINKETQKISS